MLAQTNLQLYQQLFESRWSDESIVMVREAYDLARQLFVGSYRPNHKSFLEHLVGTASALAAWGESREMVITGLLHSSYLYGEFGDGSRQMTRQKRRVVRDTVGSEAEALIQKYTMSDHLLLQKAYEEGGVDRDLPDRDVLVLRLADILDECVDAGPRFSPLKQLAFGLPANVDSRPAMTKLADVLVGPVAVRHFQTVFEQYDASRSLRGLATDDRSFHTLHPGAKDYRRTRIGRGIDWLQRTLRHGLR